MKKTIPGYDLSGGALWRHSIAVSVASEILVKALKIPDADEVFTAALLHDVGKLVLGGFVKEDLKQIETMVMKGITFDVAESMVLGTNHAECRSMASRPGILRKELHLERYCACRQHAGFDDRFRKS
jgi:HD-like signal output (HDOD) protein